MSVVAELSTLDAIAVIEAQIEDCQELTANNKGKQPAGTMTDAVFALQIQLAEMQLTCSTLHDRQIAHSMATAVATDGPLVQAAREAEQQAEQDRQFARHLQETGNASVPASAAPSFPASRSADIWTRDATLIKAAQIYMLDTASLASMTSPSLSALTLHDDQSTNAAESSTWAASRISAAGSSKEQTCSACSSSFAAHEVVQAPCGDHYCEECLAQLFELSMTDESLFPPRCHAQEISLSVARLWLPRELAQRFDAKYHELSTTNRTYCSNAKCAQWIAPANIDIGSESAICTGCYHTTCTICKGHSHGGQCPHDPALEQLRQLADSQDWQTCSKCSRIIQLEHGCNHMICRCKHEFCYVCAAPWKTCTCAQWHENRLYSRAAQIAERRPGEGGRVAAAQVHAAAARLRANHECTDHQWMMVNGRHTCESCHNVLPAFIFECRRCEVRQCLRCRLNRA